MGKGDIKTKKGKITAGSFGKKRPHQVKSVKPITAENSKESKE
ncbi:MAG TPA: 30S ribosomal protein THX [Sphingobacteriaceae bacterium]